jgi:hypothetical protein
MTMSRWDFSRRWSLHAVAIPLLLAGVGALLVYLTYGSRPTQVMVIDGVSPSGVTEQGNANAPDPMQPVQGLAPVPALELADMNATRADDSEPNRDTVAETPTAAPGSRPPAPVAPTRLPPLGYVIRGRVMSRGGPVRNDPNQWPPWPLFVQVSAPGYLRKCAIDEQGGFECSGLGDGAYVVSAVGGVVLDGYMPQPLFCSPVEVHLDQWRPTAEVVLVPGATFPLSVVVTEQDTGRPATGRSVLAAPISGASPESAITDEQGGCTLNLFPGRYRVYAAANDSDSRLVVVQPSAGNPVVSLVVPASKRKIIRVVLMDAQGSRIRGYVDISGVEWDSDVQQPTDSFHAPVPDYIPLDGFLGYAHDESGELARRFVWPQDKLDEEFEVVLEPRARIVGRVVDAAGRALPEAHVGLGSILPNGTRRDDEAFLYAPTTDGAGGFCLEGLAIGLKVQVTADRAPAYGQSEVLDLKGGATHDVGRIVLKTPERPRRDGVVRGRITDEKGRPAVDCAVTISARGEFRTDAEGLFAAAGLTEDEPFTVTVKAPDGGVWSRTAAGSTAKCDIQMHPQGWGVLGSEAPALVVDRWFNHVPVTWEDLRGRVVVLAFPPTRAGASGHLLPRSVLDVYRQYAGQGLFVIAVYRYPAMPGCPPVDENVTTSYVSGEFDNLPIAGGFDADPNLVQDVMPAGRPAGAAAGATHWLYQVSKESAIFLIDKQGRVRYCVETDGLAPRVEWLLAE